MEVGQGGITCYSSTKRSDGSKSGGITSYNSTKRFNYVDLMEDNLGKIPVITETICRFILQYSSEEEEEDLESTMANMNKKKKVGGPLREAWSRGAPNYKA